jgi:hypothetical protein
MVNAIPFAKALASLAQGNYLSKDLRKNAKHLVI